MGFIKDKNTKKIDKNDYSTPIKYFNEWDDQYFYSLDPCATAENAKCDKYFSKKKNGLIMSWEGETVFCNPPYSRSEKKCHSNHDKCKKKVCKIRGYHIDENVPGLIDWIEKCYMENYLYGIHISLLIPAATGTKAFHKFIWNKETRSNYEWIDYVDFIKGRLHFSEMKAPADFDSMLVVFKERW